MSGPLVEAAQILGSVAAIVVALTIIGKAVLGAHRIARRVEDTNDLVQKELLPNGGSSLRDAINRLEAKFDEAVDRLGSRLDRVENGRDA
jgi:hypothetical protein